RNEDHFVIMKRSRSSEILDSNLPSIELQNGRDEAYALVVADGIGGAELGDVASKLALETAIEASEMATSWLMKFRDFDAQRVQDRVDAYIERIQEKFDDFGLDHPSANKMGTTLTCAYIVPPHAIIVQIGDSRAYLFRDGELKQLTRDHTVQQLLLEQGIPDERAKKFSNVLLNSLGTSRNNVESEISNVELMPGDRLVICSDGLSDMVDDETIGEILRNHALDDALQKLIQAALDGGGRDNITVILADLTRQKTQSIE
ncbi:MAG: protein phosphatase 2C domain-containing protein, partial [Pirellulaceae bacterium]|nr:protein phosphatase 2C domain-containing protein [Pirellulaceae bacterium]